MAASGAFHSFLPPNDGPRQQQQQQHHHRCRRRRRPKFQLKMCARILGIPEMPERRTASMASDPFIKRFLPPFPFLSLSLSSFSLSLSVYVRNIRRKCTYSVSMALNTRVLMCPLTYSHHILYTFHTTCTYIYTHKRY